MKNDFNTVGKCTTITAIIFLFILLYNPVIAKGTQKGASRDSVVVSLWSGKAPFGTYHGPEKVMPSRGDGVIRITDVSKPTITIYNNGISGRSRPAILICPGGGYTHLAMNLEGTNIAAWLKKLGFIPVVLKYRVPDQRKGAFADVERAMSILRSHAKKWNINTNKIGIIGFSAGGNLAARLITHYKKRIYPAQDGDGHVSIKPNFSILIYPAYLVNKQDKVKENVRVLNQPPPVFLVQTQDDPIGYRNSLFFFNALTKAHVAAELHMYPHGGHGYGLTTPKMNPLSGWPDLCKQWLQSLHIIK